jgi:hypothetical protein
VLQVGERFDARSQPPETLGAATMPTMNSMVSALWFFFTHLVDQPDLARKLVRTGPSASFLSC